MGRRTVPARPGRGNSRRGTFGGGGAFAESRLSRALARYEWVLAHVANGIYGLDAEGRVEFVNPAAVRITGYAEGDQLGKESAPAAPRPPAGRQPVPEDRLPGVEGLADRPHRGRRARAVLRSDGHRCADRPGRRPHDRGRRGDRRDRLLPRPHRAPGGGTAGSRTRPDLPLGGCASGAVRPAAAGPAHPSAGARPPARRRAVPAGGARGPSRRRLVRRVPAARRRDDARHRRRGPTCPTARRCCWSPTASWSGAARTSTRGWTASGRR